jgi:hypothetical protein
LRRTAIGPFSVPDDESRELTVEELMRFLPERTLDAEEAARASHGRPVEGGRVSGAPLSPPRVGEIKGVAGEGPQPIRLTHGGHLIAVAREEGDQLKPEVVLA